MNKRHYLSHTHYLKLIILDICQLFVRIASYLSATSMTLHVRLLFVITILSLFSILRGTLSTISSRHNASNLEPKATKIRITSDMRRIRQMLQPFHSLLSSRKLYREYHYLLQTLWTCCPLQRDFLFDRGDVHESLLAMSDCRELTKYHQSQLSTECLANLKLFNPVTTDLSKCDGGLLRNIADEYPFIVQLYNYTKNYCVDGLQPSLIFFNISQIIRCEHAIRQRLISNSQAYNTYNTLSANLLSVYVKNLNSYYDCNDPKLWKSQDKENEELTRTMVQY
jgi:hypothetical protein